MASGAGSSTPALVANNCEGLETSGKWQLTAKIVPIPKPTSTDPRRAFSHSEIYHWRPPGVQPSQCSKTYHWQWSLEQDIVEIDGEIDEEKDVVYALDLVSLDLTVSLSSSSGKGGTPARIAHCQAKLIGRCQMRKNCYDEIEQPSQETAKLAFDIFDRYARLRPEFRQHPILKGSGVWSQELDYGDILIIEHVFVAKPYRGLQIGRTMIKTVFELIRKSTPSYFAFVRPSVHKGDNTGLQQKISQGNAAGASMEAYEHSRSLQFYRSLDFRRIGSTAWFAMSSDPLHPSREVASIEDSDPPKLLATTVNPLLREFLHPGNQVAYTCHRRMGIFRPEIGVLLKYGQLTSFDDLCWTSKDNDGNTLLHLAALKHDVYCVIWLMRRSFGPQLLHSRNYRGETPLESLEFQLEKLRTQESIGGFIQSASDKFKGYTDEDIIDCLVALKQLNPSAPNSPQSRQLIGGCTCGQCLGGFMSPRMSYALEQQATMGYTSLISDIDTLTGKEWVHSHSGVLGYLSSEVRSNLEYFRLMRHGFTALWGSVSNCLSRGNLPTRYNILLTAKDTGEWRHSAHHYIMGGGRIEPVFLAICRNAMDMDEWTGDGEYQKHFREEIELFPGCRNDTEFGYVSGRCGYRCIGLHKLVDINGNVLDEDGNIIDSLL